jgi:hypothetical protein
MTDALNLSKLAKYFSDEDAARALLEEMRWGKGGAVGTHQIADRQAVRLAGWLDDEH